MFHVYNPLPCANVYEIYILESLNIKTAPGPDNIAAIFSKMLADKIATYEELLRSLFRGIEEKQFQFIDPCPLNCSIFRKFNSHSMLLVHHITC